MSIRTRLRLGFWAALTAGAGTILAALLIAQDGVTTSRPAILVAVVAITILMLIISAASIFLASREIDSQTGELCAAMRRVGRGICDQPVDARSNGAFTEPAAAFNLMIGDIKERTERRERVGELLQQANERLERTLEARNAELNVARGAATSADKAKNVFLANMSDELHTPLTAILGFSAMMRREPGLTATQRENLDIINASGRHLLSLIHDILEVAKIEAGNMRADIAPFDLATMVRDVAGLMRVRAREKGLRLLLDQSSPFPSHIRGDEARLRQVLTNLVGNAVKFTDQGAITIRLGTRHGTPERLVIEVEDTGPGIKPEDRRRVFEPFVQLPDIAAQRGTGLGLTICRRNMTIMGGDMSVESTPGRGSTFRIELPFEPVSGADVAELEMPVQFGEVAGLAPGQPNWRVIVADDQRESALLLSRLMTDIGVEVKVAENGERCVQLFEEWHPHLIWMDSRMPVIDGKEAARRIRALPGGKDVKIVAVTPSAFREHWQDMLSAGMDEFVRRPYRFYEVYDCMARLLGVKYV